jgi:hypothetical protein
MKLPEDIRLKIEQSADKEDILLLLARLESDGVEITRDVYTAIVANPRVHATGACRIDLYEAPKASPVSSPRLRSTKFG